MINYQSKEKLTLNKGLVISAAVSIILLFITISKINAQIDPTFGTNGVTITDVADDDRPVAAFTLPDEKILVVNEGENTYEEYYLLRYNSDGSSDTSYGINGKIQLAIPFNAFDRYFYKAVRQPDGKIVLIGYAVPDGLVVRVNEDGTLDTSFGGTGIIRPNINPNRTDLLTAAVIQPDGKILIVGNAYNQMGTAQTFLTRYLSDGSIDQSFGNAGHVIYTSPFGDEFTYSIHLQSNGKIITSHASATFGSPVGGVIRRYNTNGSLDNSFTQIELYFRQLKVSTVLPDDKIIIAERVNKADTLERNHTDAQISRYNADGTPDTNFGTNGRTSIDITTAFDDTPNGLKVLADGQLIVSTTTNVPANRNKTYGTMLSLARLSPNGTINGKFFKTKAAIAGEVILLTTPTGKIVSIGRVLQPNFQSDTLLARAIDVPIRTYKFQAVPFDFRGTDGVADIAVFRPENRRWYINEVIGDVLFGIAGDVPVPSDYLGNFTTELAVFRPSTGQWFISINFAPNSYIPVQWGEPGDIPAPADYDGDSKSDIAVFRPSTGNWHIRNSANNSTTIVHWGLNGDKPAPGDYDGDGLYDIAVFRPSEGNWYILQSSDGGYTITRFGLSGDIPVQEDYDGDGKFDIALWRPSDRVWYRLNSSDGSFYALQWGISTDTAAPADYDGDGKADIAVWRAAEGRWYVLQSNTNSMSVYNWGLNTDVPLPRKL